MLYELSGTQLRNLAEDIDNLYTKTHELLGTEDLEYARNLKNYSIAIKKRSDGLLKQPDTENAFQKSIILRGIHLFLEFSLGHLILHGSYDDLLDTKDEFHSSNYKWDFALDIDDWKIMHHKNHHPFTNIKGLDHDLGYGLFRIKEGQNWWGHNFIQIPLFMGAMLSHSTFFSMFTSYSAGNGNGKTFYNPGIYKNSLRALSQEFIESYIKEPVRAKHRFLPTATGNLLGNMFGYTYLMLNLSFAHHKSGLALYEKQDRNETKGEYYYRQIMATTNFITDPEIDIYLQKILDEVEYSNRPALTVLHDAVNNHIEHHLFPDIPGNRLRELGPEVQEILKKYGLPYSTTPFREALNDLFKGIVVGSIPTTDKERSIVDIFKRPLLLSKRVFYGVTYRSPSEPFYLGDLHRDKVTTRVLESVEEVSGQSRSFRIETPESWKKMEWEAGSYISIEVEIGGISYIRQYSLTHDSQRAKSLDITVKRIKDGKVSNYLNDKIRKGNQITLFRRPQGEDGFIMKETPKKPVFIAGGVGITPLMSMIRKITDTEPNNQALLLYFNRNENSIIFHDELKRLEKTSGIRIQYIFSPSTEQSKHLEVASISKDLLEKHIPDLHDRELYTCAPDGFILKVKGYLKELDYDMTKFHMEMFKPPEVRKSNEASHVYHTIKFLKSGKEVRVNENTTLLEASIKAGVSVLTGCEKGLCKACVCPKVDGVTQLEDGNDDTFLNKITICNTVPRSDIGLYI